MHMSENRPRQLKKRPLLLCRYLPFLAIGNRPAFRKLMQNGARGDDITMMAARAQWFLPELLLTAVIMPIGASAQRSHDFIGNRADICGHCLNRVIIMNQGRLINAKAVLVKIGYIYGDAVH